MDWPTRKRVFYSELMQTYTYDQARAEQALHGEGDADVDSLLAEADWHDKTTSTATPSAAPSQTPPGVDVDTDNIPRPDEFSPDETAPIDNRRVTRRENADANEPGREKLYDMREIHPAVRKHGNVIRVRGDDEPEDTQAGDLDSDADADE